MSSSIEVHIRQAKGGTLCGRDGPSVTIRWRRKVTCEACKRAHALIELTRETERLGLYDK